MRACMATYIHFLQDVEFSRVKELLLERALQYTSKMESSRAAVALNASSFIGNSDCVVLVHGYSEVVVDILALAASAKKVFRTIVTESRMDGSG
jgi:translation initiation factor eIF-2B subunit alpha